MNFLLPNICSDYTYSLYISFVSLSRKYKSDTKIMNKLFSSKPPDVNNKRDGMLRVRSTNPCCCGSFLSVRAQTFQRGKRRKIVSMKAYFLLTIGKQTLREEKEMSITAVCLFIRQSNNVACVKVSNRKWIIIIFQICTIQLVNRLDNQ